MFDTHFIQHIVQIDKTLIAIRQAASESKLLLRKLYAVFPEAESILIGAEKMDDTVMHATASSISERTREIESLLR